MQPEFHIELPQVRAASHETARVADGLTAQVEALTAEELRPGDFAGIAAAAAMASEWAQALLPRHRAALDEIAEALDSHVRDMSETDQVAAGALDEYRL